jgi:ankyrin repeat protein
MECGRFNRSHWRVLPVIRDRRLAKAVVCCVVISASVAGCAKTRSEDNTAKRKDDQQQGTAPQPAAATVSAKPDIEPQLGQARLLIDGRTLVPLRTTATWHPKYRTGDLRIEIDGASLSVHKPGEIGSSWSVNSDDGKHLNWLAASAHLAYFAAYDVDKEGQFQKFCEPPEIRRLDLDKHRWLERLPAPKAEQANRKPGEVQSALADERRLFVLTTVVEANPSDQRTHVTAYVVRGFAHGQARPIWTVTFPANGEREYTGGLLWAASVPFYPASNIQHLSLMGDRLLVCAEAKQPIYCLEPDSGTEIWRCERLWEYQRGFIGPSVWSHYIGRFGIDESFGEANDQKTAAARREFEKQFNGSIIAGPVAVPLNFARDNATHSIFVAVSREPARTFGGYLADCVVYELDDAGKPISLVNLPQAVIGSKFQPLPNALVWCGANESMFQVRASQRSATIGMGPGGPDALTRIGWFRQPADAEPAAWLVTGRTGDRIAMGPTHAVRQDAGGYVASKDEAMFHFPLAVVDLASGAERPIEIQVPFRGKLDAPMTNYRAHGMVNGETSFHTMGPYLLGITSLTLDGSHLEVVLGMTNRAMSTEFELGPLAVGHNKPSARSDAEDAWIKSLRSSPHDKADLDAQLHSTIAYDVDTRRLKALLDAGANPRARSKNGWNALMVAACYGSAAGVDLMVDAGSDVNAHDSNCGGQSVLMWAARSGREGKRKVKRLLAAGADRSYATSDGYNALMSASGNVAVIELLLAQGMDVNHRTADGKSVLMDAAYSAPPSVLTVLIKAGAQVNDSDREGKTVLMHAVEGFDRLNPTRVLLDAGADPNRKDKAGRTALDMCRASDRPEREALARLLESAMKPKAK